MLRVDVDSLGWRGDSVFQGEAVADSCAQPHAKGRGPVAGGLVRADGGAQKHQRIAAAPCPRGRGYLQRRLRRAQRATLTTLQPHTAKYPGRHGSGLAQEERQQRPCSLPRQQSGTEDRALLRQSDGNDLQPPKTECGTARVG